MSAYMFQTGDQIIRSDKSIVIAFSGPRKVLSTSPLNGGYREDLTHVFNHDCMNSDGIAVMNGKTYREHMINTVLSLRLDPNTTAGLETGVPMESAANCSEICGDTQVCVISTAGVYGNAARAGDKASWDETCGIYQEKQVGTINSIVYVNANLTAGAMAGAMMVCTEAKTAVLQELVVQSKYSQGLATGTGTDGLIVVSNAESQCMLTDAGKHTKLGEMLGRCTMHSIRTALGNYGNLNCRQQHDVAKRLDRFNISSTGITPENRSRKEYVTAAALLARLLDENAWGLLDEKELIEGSEWVLTGCAKAVGKDFQWDAESIRGRQDVINQWNRLVRD